MHASQLRTLRDDGELYREMGSHGPLHWSRLWKLRQLLTPHGALDRIFLTPEDPAIRARRKQARSVVSFCHRAGPPLHDRVRVLVSFASRAVVNLTF